MRIYLAGPMRGVPEFNFPAFHAAAAALRAKGHHLNPAERDIERHGGIDISKGNATGSNDLAVTQHGFDIRAALADDMDFICRHADAVVLLPNWDSSKGAKAEQATAIALGLHVLLLSEVI